jgi:flavin-dependent dehydrogenase
MTLSPCDTDLLVIGGGPGGSTAAALARKKGLQVLVVEKEQFPRFRIGESMLPAANAIMRETGVWPKVEGAGFVPKYGAVFHTADGRATQEIIFNDSSIPGLEGTYQVERSRFDALLLDHARELGAEVRMQTKARLLPMVGDHHRAVLDGPAGSEEVTARWLIEAGGRDNPLQNRVAQDLDPSPFPKRVAIFSHFTGVGRAAGRAGGHTVVVRLEDGWFWLIPIDAERTSVGLVTTVAAMRAAAVSPEELFRAAVRRSAKLSELFTGAAAAMPFHVTSDYSYFRRTIAGERWLKVGDAAGFFDPIFSSGVYVSMWSARQAVELIAPAEAAGRALTPREQSGYARHLKKHAGVFAQLIGAFYDNASFEVFMAPQIPFNLRPGISAIVAGHARLTWPLWWRFQVFRLACLLQRRVSLCRKLNLGSTPLPA